MADDPAILPTSALITNSITHGYGSDAHPADLSKDFPSVLFQNCMFKAKGPDDANFSVCYWDADPLFYTVRNDYLFDYRVKPDSPAIGKSDLNIGTSLSPIDFYGCIRNSDLGAYVFVKPAE